MARISLDATRAVAQVEVQPIYLDERGGSPEGSESLCGTCTRGHVIRGFRATEELVFCRFFYIEREIHFPVRECTFYEDRRLASKEDMEEIAWRLTTIKPTRHVGFASAVQFRQMQEAAENSAAVAASEPQSATSRD